MITCALAAVAPSVRSEQWAVAARRAVHPAVLHADDDWLWAVASGLASVAVPWELREATSDHAGELVLATDQYEVWVLSWAPGTSGAWHDHTDVSACCVVAGDMVETVIDPTGGRRVRRFGPGAGSSLAAGHRHLVANPGPHVLTSLHVYTGRPTEPA